MERETTQKRSKSDTQVAVNRLIMYGIVLPAKVYQRFKDIMQ